MNKFIKGQTLTLLNELDDAAACEKPRKDTKAPDNNRFAMIWALEEEN